MIFLIYVEDSKGNADIRQCRDEIHYLDMLVDIESRATTIPTDIRWHGDAVIPAMRILALSTDNDDLSIVAHNIIHTCSLWLRQN